MALKDMLRTMKEDLVRGVADTRDSLAEKNRKSALTNRLRSLIKLEEARRDRAYMALGRYFYHNLRDEDNAVTQPHCAAVEEAEENIRAALAQLEKLMRGSDMSMEEALPEEPTEAVDEEQDPVTAAANTQFIELPVEEAARDGENDFLPFE